MRMVGRRKLLAKIQIIMENRMSYMLVTLMKMLKMVLIISRMVMMRIRG